MPGSVKRLHTDMGAGGPALAPPLRVDSGSWLCLYPWGLWSGGRSSSDDEPDGWLTLTAKVGPLQAGTCPAPKAGSGPCRQGPPLCGCQEGASHPSLGHALPSETCRTPLLGEEAAPPF